MLAAERTVAYAFGPMRLSVVVGDLLSPLDSGGLEKLNVALRGVEGHGVRQNF